MWVVIAWDPSPQRNAKPLPPPPLTPPAGRGDDDSEPLSAAAHVHSHCTRQKHGDGCRRGREQRRQRAATAAVPHAL
eukprot:15958-Chlamydomonas_euryale.AAC.1